MAPAAHTPWLLAGACDLSSPLLLRDYAVRTFGELAAATLPTEAAFYTGPSASLSHTEWQRALAEELLLAHILGATLPHIILKLFHHILPLDTCPLPLDELLGRRAAVTMIPLDGGTHAPSCAHLWLVEDPRAPRGTLPGWASLPAACEIRGSRFAIHTVCARPPTSPITGESHQLALWLLQRALAEDYSNAISALALKWIITGKNNDPFVGPVDLGNKLRLHVPRRWLLPKTNKRTRPIRTARAVLTNGADFAETLLSAWNIITGAGARFEGTMRWPRGVDTLHSFVSGAWQPVVASVLLTRPRSLVLWYSGSDWLPYARTLEDLLTTLLPNLSVTISHITSSNLVEAEHTLKEALPPSSNDNTVTLFNITQGNRLMGLATLGVALHNPNLWLIYRDLDAAPFHFTMIRYEHDNTPHTYLLDGTTAAQRSANILWDKLFTRITPRPMEPCSELLRSITTAPVRNSSPHP